MRQVLIPRDAGVFCASGMLVTDVRHDSLLAYHAQSDNLDLQHLDALFADLESAAGDRLSQEGFARGDMRFERFVDARYPGQVHELTIPVPSVDHFTAADTAAIESAFHERHEREFTYGRRRVAGGVPALAGECTWTHDHVAARKREPLEPSPNLQSGPVWATSRPISPTRNGGHAGIQSRTPDAGAAISGTRGDPSGDDHHRTKSF